MIGGVQIGMEHNFIPVKMIAAEYDSNDGDICLYLRARRAATAAGKR